MTDVVFAAGLLSEAPPSFRENLAPAGIHCREAPDEELQTALRDADAVVCYRLTPNETRSARRLRLVQSLSTGADRIDRAALPAGCALCNVYGHEIAIAEWVVMAMLALHRRLLVFDRDLRAGRWHRTDDDWLQEALSGDLGGRTVGTIGFGPIGARVATLARGIGMEAIAVTRSPSPERAGGLAWLGGLADLPRLLSESDFVVVAVPLRPQTERLIGERELETLGPDGFLLNVARGGIVDEEALFGALRDGRIAGAGIDVWWRYPGRDGAPADPPTMPASFPFWELDNVVMTPHMSGRSLATTRRRWEFVAAQLQRFARGQPLANVLEVRDAS